MAIRNIRKEEDKILRKISREVTKFDSKLHQLLDDMAETMYEAPGIGLAAVQVGILKRAAVIDTGEGVIEVINGKITYAEGEKEEVEGCLSIPDVYGKVIRPEKVTVNYQNRNGEKKVIEATELLAVALCHELDHFDGVLFIDKVVEYINFDSSDEEEEDNKEI